MGIQKFMGSLEYACKNFYALAMGSVYANVYCIVYMVDCFAAEG